jgi:hypothetical protein
MEKRRGIWALTVLCSVFVLLGAGTAFAVDVPEKLKDIPLYQGSTVQQALDMQNNVMLVAAVKAKGSDIADFYKKTMTAKGWKVAFQAEQNDVKIVHFQKDKLVFQVTIQLENGGEAKTYHLMMITQ